ncbi:MAG: hypothetical protein ACRD3G_20825 [Vicinamibacterales bacterium]
MTRCDVVFVPCGLLLVGAVAGAWRRSPVLPERRAGYDKWEYNYPGWTIRPSLAITAGF